MAKCKCCQKRGFTVETDVNGLCASCAPYYYLTLSTDLKELEQTIKAIERINQPEAALGRIGMATELLERLRPYVMAGLAELPMPIPQLERYLNEQKEYWHDNA